MKSKIYSHLNEVLELLGCLTYKKPLGDLMSFDVEF